jgi:hypothetical protein
MSRIGLSVADVNKAAVLASFADRSQFDPLRRLIGKSPLKPVVDAPFN